MSSQPTSQPSGGPDQVDKQDTRSDGRAGRQADPPAPDLVIRDRGGDEARAAGNGVTNCELSNRDEDEYEPL